VIAEAVRDVKETTSFPLPVSPLIATVGVVPAVSHSNPVGALKMIVPDPIAPFPDSVSTGPVNVVNVPLAVSAEIEVPPVAAVTLTFAAIALSPLASEQKSASKNLCNFFISFRTPSESECR